MRSDTCLPRMMLEALALLFGSLFAATSCAAPVGSEASQDGVEGSVVTAADTKNSVSVGQTTESLIGSTALTFSAARSCCYANDNPYCTQVGTMRVVFNAATGAAVSAEANCLTWNQTWRYATWGGNCTTDLCNFDGEIRCDVPNSGCSAVASGSGYH